MKIHKLGGTDGFIVFDLDGAPHSVGITRLAPKILVDGATLLARTNTYLFATYEQQAGGASAGINAKPDGRDAAVAAFVAEVAPLVEAGTFLTGPGRGLTDADLEGLQAVDPRAAFGAQDTRGLLGTGVAAAAERAAGGLEGRTVAVEGLDTASSGIVTELAARGAVISAVGSTAGSVADAAGIDAAALAAALDEQGPAAISALGLEVGAPGAVLAAEVDVLCAGSKVGLIDHEAAAGISARIVVPSGPVPVTAKGLAALRRRDVVVLPDFITASGTMFASFPDDGASFDDVRAAVVEEVTGALGEVLGHEDGPLLAACYRAEAFLRTWQDTLPFGRPLA